jgi:Carboxypeptidase regulatory-like domain
MAPRRAPKRAVWRGHRIWPWALAAVVLALLPVWQLSRLLLRPAPAPVEALTEAPLPLDGGVGTDSGRASSRSLPLLTILDAHGAPVAGCTVVLRVPGQRLQEAVRDGAEVCDGVQLDGVPPGEYLLSAEAAGFRRSEVPVHLGPGPVSLRLVLQEGPLLSGRVVDGAGRPVPGVSVAVSPTEEVAHSDDAGLFRLSVPGPGVYGLEAHHSEYGGATASVSVPASPVSLRLLPRAVLALKVLSGGQPVQGAQVLLFDGRDSGPGGQYEADSATDAEGNLRVQGLPAGSYTLGVMRPGALSSSRQPVVLREGLTTSVSVVLPPVPTGTLQGTVEDAAGSALEGAFVRVQPFDVPPVQSDAQGRFLLTGVTEGVDYQVVAVLGASTSASRRARAGDAVLRLQLPSAKRYRGRVLDERQVPIHLFRVGEVAVEADDGRFLLPLTASGGTVTLTVEAPGLAMASLQRPAEVEEVGDVVLHPAPAVHGVVLNASGTPAAGALVVCEGCRGETAGERRLTALSDAEGRFTLYATAAFGVLVRLVAMKDGQLGWAEAGRAGEAARLTLARPSSVKGRVLRPSGNPAAGVAVVFVEPLLEPLLLVTGRDGSFSGEVPPGLYQVTLSPDTSTPRRTWTVQVPVDRPLVFTTGAVP